MIFDNAITLRIDLENYYFASEPCDVSQVRLKQLRANKIETLFKKITDRRIETCQTIFQEEYMQELTEETLELIDLAKKSF